MAMAGLASSLMAMAIAIAIRFYIECSFHGFYALECRSGYASAVKVT